MWSQSAIKHRPHQYYNNIFQFDRLRRWPTDWKIARPSTWQHSNSNWYFLQFFIQIVRMQKWWLVNFEHSEKYLNNAEDWKWNCPFFYSLHLRAIFTRIRHSFIVKHFHTKIESYSWDMRMWRITMCNIRFSFSNSGMCFFAFLRSVSKNRWTYSHNCTARFNLKWNDERQRKLDEEK